MSDSSSGKIIIISTQLYWYSPVVCSNRIQLEGLYLFILFLFLCYKSFCISEPLVVVNIVVLL